MEFEDIETDEYRAILAEWTAGLDAAAEIDRRLGIKPWQDLQAMPNPYAVGSPEHDAFEDCRAQYNALWLEHWSISKRLDAARARQNELNLKRFHEWRALSGANT